MLFGVAIEVPAPHGPHLRAKRASFGDPQAVMIPTHVTLTPPAEIDDLDEIRVRLGRVAAAMDPFEICLDGSGTFRPVSPVVFVKLVDGIEQTVALAAHVREAIDAAEPQFPFHPHVTVAHDVDEDALDRAEKELADYSCRFAVTRFALWIHHPHDGWQADQHFDLLGTHA